MTMAADSHPCYGTSTGFGDNTVETFLNIWQQHERRFATAVCVMLVVLMMAGVMKTVMFVIDDLNPVAGPPVDSPVAARQSARRFSVAELDLFGRVDAEAPRPIVTDAPETRLNLELQGIFASDDPNDSAAIIGQKNTSELYQIGDSISGDATLDSVHGDHILIRRGTRLEKLLFSDDSMRAPELQTTRNEPPKLSETSDSRTQRLAEIRQRIETRRIERSEQTDTEGSSQPDSPGASIRNFVDENRDMIENDPAGALSRLGVQPVENGAAKGYRLDNNNPVLSQAGLRSGDVIMSVNGRPVGVAANDSALIDQVLEQRRVRVEVQRDNRRFFLTVPIP